MQVYEPSHLQLAADERLLPRVEAAYAEAGLEPKIAKRFRFADEFNAIGARIDGRDAWVSAKAELLLVGLAFECRPRLSRALHGQHSRVRCRVLGSDSAVQAGGLLLAGLCFPRDHRSRAE